MSKTLKAIFLSIYCAIFLHCLKYLLLNRSEEILELNYLTRTPGTMRKILQDIKKNRKNLTQFTMDFKRPERFPTDLKFILKWNQDFMHPSQAFLEGQKTFMNHKCTYFNCYLTNNKGILVDMRYFDAILFDLDSDWDEHPPLRAPYQNYIFTAFESSSYNPICNGNYDNYYNLTWTYKLDSDISRSSIVVLNKNGFTIGPKIDVNWISPMKPISDEVKRKIKGKKKTVAWINFNCASENPKVLQKLIKNLNDSLISNKLSLDVYGWCGKLKCPQDRIEECLMFLKRDYYFYLAFESSFSVDYVSEKILYALQNYAVPIVYGGANYSRFLPPGSYIDAGKLEPEEVVSKMIKAINNPDVYNDYFRWHNHYIYKEAPKHEGICDLCKLLNESKRKFNVIRHFRQWWNPDYKVHCH